MNNELKHTPGPWDFTLTGQIWKKDGPNESHNIAFVYEGEFNRFKADVHLIAAAPDLLEALQIALGQMIHWHGAFKALPDGDDTILDTIKISEAAIAKATNGGE